ncbi:MAG: hypothetical protein WBE68_07080 [Candidatus Nitrosopolaris sp.]
MYKALSIQKIRQKYKNNDIIHDTPLRFMRKKRTFVGTPRVISNNEKKDFMDPENQGSF